MFLLHDYLCSTAVVIKFVKHTGGDSLLDHRKWHFRTPNVPNWKGNKTTTDSTEDEDLNNSEISQLWSWNVSLTGKFPQKKKKKKNKRQIICLICWQLCDLPISQNEFCKHGGNFKKVTFNINKIGLLYSYKYYYIVAANFNIL